MRSPLRHFLALAIACLLITRPGSAAENSARRNYSLPADEAATSLKLFSQQSGHGVIVGADVVKGVRTNAVHGELTASEALTHMLAGTGLVAAQHERNGAFAIRRETGAPNGQRAAPPATSDRPSQSRNKRPTDEATEARDEILELSPFEVVSSNRGYYASGTMSGTRLNSKVEDLASSLTVVTKEQMADFAMLDVNDIFLYEAGTEGTGTFTDISFDRNGTPVDNTQLDPNNANRVRGVSAANISFGNYETSGRVPIDPVIIEAVEISRGPNANVFGLGNAGGTVNLQPASANLGRERAQVSVRGDSFDGYRGSLDINRVLKKGVLAVRGSAVYQHVGFDRKPSGTNTRRLTGMVKFQPFKYTTLRAFYSHYHIDGNRPNTSMPRDFVSGWIKAGRPTYNPVAQRVTLNGVVLPAQHTPATIASTGYFTQFSGVNTLYVNGDGSVGYWQQSRSTGSTINPDAAKQNLFLAIPTPEPVRVGQPLFGSDPSVSDKTLYDWSSINLAATNRLNETTKTANLELDQIFFNTPRQMLAVNAGFFREDSQRYRRDFLGANTDSFSGNLYVDVNERMLDGSPNPYFLRPYTGVRFPTSTDSPLRWETYRVQLAYKLDLTREKNALRWLGRHQLNGYGEYKDRVQRRLTYRDVILSNHAWLASNAVRANTSGPASPNVTRNWFNYYVGDNAGPNVDYAPRDFSPGTYDFRWGNGETGAFVSEPALLGPAPASNQSSGPNHTRRLIKTQGGVAQSHFWGDRVVTILGLRRDEAYNRLGAPGRFLPNDGSHLDLETFNQWAPGDWATIRSGQTKQAGVVLKPIRWLNLHANVSDSFQPSDVKFDLHLQPLPDPTGKGHDYGFTLNLLEGRLVARFIQHKTTQINGRSLTPEIAGRTRVIDFESSGFISSPDPFNLVQRATTWVLSAAAARGQTLTTEQINAQVATLTGLSAAHLAATAQSTGDFSATADIIAKGNELELNYNPSNFWTLKLNVTEKRVIESKLSTDISTWIAERMPVWTTIVDPTVINPATGQLGDRFWDHAGYNPANPAQTPHQWFDANVVAQLKVAQANEGKSRPQIRRYNANVSTSYRLAGITGHAIAKRFTIGGALRWEDKGAIGYHGLQQLPAIITEFDPSRPVYDKARLYADALVGYRTRLFSNKVAANFQVNVRNLQENGRLQAVKAFPDGRPSAYRIVDPRQFILTATFDL